MPRTSIQQFRAALTNGADQSPLTRAYRQIARGLAPGAARIGGEWVTWPPAMAAGGDWILWAGRPASAERQARPRFAAWGDWAAPPATAA